jgi:hypothetical protein
MWGGAHNLIVPTDGKTIHNRFWAILERFSPDSIYYYQPDLDDIKDLYPEDYACCFCKEFETHSPFLFSKELDSQIIKRLNPFHPEYIDDCEHPNAHWINAKTIYRLKSPHRGNSNIATSRYMISKASLNREIHHDLIVFLLCFSNGYPRIDFQ